MSVVRKYRHHKGNFFFLLFCFSFFSPFGCTTAPEPRVIAERVFAGDRLTAVITTYPGDPEELTVLSCKASEDVAGDINVEKIEIEGRPGWRLQCDAPIVTEELTLRVVVCHAGRRFAVTIPFRRRETFIAGQGNVPSWTTRRERITNLGPDIGKNVFLTRNP